MFRFLYLSDLVQIGSDRDLDLYLYQDSDVFLCSYVWFDLYFSDLVSDCLDFV